MGCVMKKLFLSLFLVLFFNATALAESSVWMVRHGDSVAYLAGTCHVLRASDFPLPEEFEAAYADSDTLAFEVDIAEMSDPANQQKFLKEVLYPPGQGLDQVLEPETYRMLAEYCAAVGLPMVSLNQFKPSMVVLTLLGVELQRLGVGQTGVDRFYYDKARADGKQRAALETLAEQFRFLAALGEGDEDNFVRHSLAELDQTGEILDKLIAAWRSGDEAALEKFIITDMRSNFPGTYQDLIVDRNAAWLPQIEAWLATPETEMVLVGAGHLVGDEGLVTTLRARGYKVEKLP